MGLEGRDYMRRRTENILQKHYGIPRNENGWQPNRMTHQRARTKTRERKPETNDKTRPSFAATLLITLIAAVIAATAYNFLT